MPEAAFCVHKSIPWVATRADEWLVTPLSKSDLPAIIVKDTDDDITHDDPSGSSDHSLKIEIEIYAADDRMTAESLRSKVLDVLLVIGAPEGEGEYLGDYRSVCDAYLTLHASGRSRRRKARTAKRWRASGSASG